MLFKFTFEASIFLITITVEGNHLMDHMINYGMECHLFHRQQEISHIFPDFEKLREFIFVNPFHIRGQYILHHIHSRKNSLDHCMYYYFETVDFHNHLYLWIKGHSFVVLENYHEWCLPLIIEMMDCVMKYRVFLKKLLHKGKGKMQEKMKMT